MLINAAAGDENMNVGMPVETTTIRMDSAENTDIQSQSGRRLSWVAIHRSVAFLPQEGQARLWQALVMYLIADSWDYRSHIPSRR